MSIINALKTLFTTSNQVKVNNNNQQFVRDGLIIVITTEVSQFFSDCQKWLTKIAKSNITSIEITSTTQSIQCPYPSSIKEIITESQINVDMLPIGLERLKVRVLSIGDIPESVTQLTIECRHSYLTICRAMIPSAVKYLNLQGFVEFQKEPLASLEYLETLHLNVSALYEHTVAKFPPNLKSLFLPYHIMKYSQNQLVFPEGLEFLQTSSANSEIKGLEKTRLKTIHLRNSSILSVTKLPNSLETIIAGTIPQNCWPPTVKRIELNVSDFCDIQNITMIPKSITTVNICFNGRANELRRLSDRSFLVIGDNKASIIQLKYFIRYLFLCMSLSVYTIDKVPIGEASIYNYILPHHISNSVIEFTDQGGKLLNGYQVITDRTKHIYIREPSVRIYWDDSDDDPVLIADQGIDSLKIKDSLKLVSFDLKRKNDVSGKVVLSPYIAGSYTLINYEKKNVEFKRFTMIPSQIVTGAANPNPNTFSCTHLNDEIYFAYSSGRNVYILRGGSLNVLQVLTGHKQDVNCVVFRTGDSLLLTASSKEIYLYKRIDNNKWERLLVIPNLFDINTICWLSATSFIVGGEFLAIWKLEFEQIMKSYSLQKLQDQQHQSTSYTTRSANDAMRVDAREQKLFRKQAYVTWRADCSQPIYYVAAAPDGSMFATAGKCDRMLKVWYIQPKIKTRASDEESAAAVAAAAAAAAANAALHAQPVRTKGFFKDEFNKLTSKEPKYTLKKSTAVEMDDDQQQQQQQQPTIQMNASISSPLISSPMIGGGVGSLASKKTKKIESDSYGFIYLPHPRAISWISWRSRRLQFNVSNIIPAGAETVDWIFSLSPQRDINNNNNSNSNSNNSNGSNQESGTSKTDNNNNVDGHNDIDNVELSNMKTPIMLRQKAIAQLAKSKPVVDWILGIKADGTLVLWKLRTDNSSSKQTSSISLSIKAQILSPQEVGPNRIFALYQPNSITDNTPSTITICVNSVSGAISCRKFFIQNQNQTQITNTSHTSRCFGHKSTIKKLSVSNSSPYLSSIDRNNSIILWHSWSDSSRIQCPYRLIDAGSVGGNVNSLAWSPTHNYLFSASKEGILVYQMDSHEHNHRLLKLPIGVIDQSSFEGADDWIEEVHVIEPQKHVYPKEMLPLHQYFIVGLSKDGHRIYVWGVSIEKSTLQQQRNLDQQLNGVIPISTSNGHVANTNPTAAVAAATTATTATTNANTNVATTSTPASVLSASTKEWNKDLYSSATVIPASQGGLLQHSTSSSTPPSLISSKLLAVKELDSESRISCICAAPKGISNGISTKSLYEGMLPDQSATPTATTTSETANSDTFSSSSTKSKFSFENILSHPICITGSISGNITVWSLTPHTNPEDTSTADSLNPIWRLTETCSYSAYQHPVVAVKPAYFGRFASTPFTTSPNPEIHIWELESNTPKLQLEETIKLGDHSEQSGSISTVVSPNINSTMEIPNDEDSTGNQCCFSFTYFEDGAASLAVGFGSQIRVLRKPVDRTIGSYKSSWIETHRYTDLTSPAQNIEWGKDLELFVTSGNQMLVFTKWMRPNQNLISLLDGTNSNLETTYHQHSILNRSLSYYHPKLLTEYMMAGKFEKVEKILKYISAYLINRFPIDDDDLPEFPTHPIHLPYMKLEELISDDMVETTDKKAGTEDDIDAINSKYFARDNDSDEEDQFTMKDDTNIFTKKQAAQLNEILSHVKLAGLLNSEQIQLLALADTYGQIGEMRGGLDENGSRFLLVVKIFQFLRRSLNPQERPTSLSATDLLWALHSEAQETILQNCFPSEPLWEDLKQLGAGLWIKSPNTLRTTIEKLAKTTYLINKEPSDCALYYIALNKRGSLIALHKASKNVKHVEFLSQDFTQQKCINSAAKSAFLLQSKHKYDLAASMFLLAGDLKQAINLILQVKGDFQLAYVIARLFEGDGGATSQMILQDHVIPHAKKTDDRCLLSIANWLSKKYEDSLKVLLPSTIIDDTRKKLDEHQTHSPAISLNSSRSSLTHTTSPKPMSNVPSQTKSMNNNDISAHLKVSEMGPSVLYFFRFLKNHVLLKQVSDEKKKDAPFLRSSTYSYLNSGCSYLALENIEDLEATHPTLVAPTIIDESPKLEEQNTPKPMTADDLGLDFGGTSTSRVSNDLGLDFGGGSTSSSYFNTSSNYDMGLDFGTTSSSYVKSNDMGLDFGAPTSSSNYSSSNYDMGLDFGSTSNSYVKSNDMGLDFGAPPTTTASSYMGLDFGEPTVPTPNIVVNDQELLSSRKLMKHDREKISLYPMIDIELKAKIVLQLLIHDIVAFIESNTWKENQSIFDHNLNLLSEKYRLDRTLIIDRLIHYCSNRQYYKQVVHLTSLIGKNPNHFLDTTCHNILKSIFKTSDYIQSQQQSEYLIKLSLELYSCLEDIQQTSVVIFTIYIMLFLSSWGRSRFDILILIFQEKGLPELIANVRKLKNQYSDNPIMDENDEEEDDEDDDLYKDKQKLAEELLVKKCLQKIFDLFCLRKFKKMYDLIINTLEYHQVYDIIHQRIHYWFVSIQNKFLTAPHQIFELFYKKPNQEAGPNLLKLVKKFRDFNTENHVELWSSMVKDNELLELLSFKLIPEDQRSSDAMKQSGQAASGKRIKYEDVVELYKDSDLLQSFCVDTSAPEIQVVAVATTRGIREIDLKQSHESSRDDFDMDSVGGADTFLSPTMTKKLRISSKSISTLKFKNKSGVFKNPFSNSKQVDHNIIVQCLESHPDSPYYLSGGIDGSVCLWQFGIPEALAAYQLPTKPRIVKCKFNQSGSKFGACDMAGNIMLWQFSAQENTLNPFYTLQAHSKQCLDFTFLNAGSLLATAGISVDSKKDVCLWDVLLPPHKSLVASYIDQESGASSITYSPKNQTVIVGGKKGSLTIYDIRTNKTLDNFKGHSLNTKSLALDPTEDFVVSGSSDGNIKTWSLPSMTCLDTIEDAHKKQTFVGPTSVFKSLVSTYGVIQVKIENNNLYSCGADGRLTKRKYLYKK
ncbi:WD-40 repeat-containing protein [Heterostelium album PN500]|uniref:WD-40 repeat-containing protein n=1 Tax=Heterostelium pallidum (strain ATCC 26659 / Pp 5 / PN500) TaxID=670386 RepID=D3BDV7_HETP5|nr:WD-40 repeat-containing protein [Heterostelium album PN500]EFA80088.1 WD-40 repeat-containing protein [Heterostelium album PN500]|eukprot:XP_020432208.1 WD-40 repeat-containing protein [Heterostelium album PN500]